MSFIIPEKVKNILTKLNEHGEAYLVGGCVRDMLIGIEPKDYDITTNLSSIEVLEIFPRGHHHGMAFWVAVVDDIEIATYRKDVYDETGELAGVGKVTSLEEDLSRRDFTFNAVALGIDGEIIDPFGGQEDLKNKLIRFVGDSEKRIEEDPVRMIRACRFAGNLKATFNEDSFRAIYQNTIKLQRVANERLRIEILKIIDKDIIDTFMHLLNVHLLEHFLYPLSTCVGVDQNKHHNETVFIHNLLSAEAVSKRYPLLRLAMLLHDIGKPATKVMGEDGEYHFYNHEDIGEKLARDLLTTLKFSNKEINYVCSVIRYHMFHFDKDTKNSTLKRFMAKLEKESVLIEDVLRARIADRRGNLAKTDRAKYPFMFKHILKRVRKIQKEEQALKVTDLKINGDDLIELGFTPGPIFKEVLKKCLNEVVEETLENDRDVLIGYVKERFVQKEKE